MVNLEREMATHSSILAWRISWKGGWNGTVHGGHKDSDTTEVTAQHMVNFGGVAIF